MNFCFSFIRKSQIAALLVTVCFVYSCQLDPKTEAQKAAALAAKESQRLNTFLDSIFEDQLSRNPVFQTRLGIKKDYDKLADISDSAQKVEIDHWNACLSLLPKRFDVSKLDYQGQLTYRLFEREANNAIDGFKWRFHNYPVTQMGGIPSEMPAFLMNMHLIADAKDAHAYISRLNAFPKLFDQLVAQLKQRELMKIIPPHFVFASVSSDCENLMKGVPFEPNAQVPSALLEDFQTKVSALKLDSAVQAELLSECTLALQNSVKPAYEHFLNYWKELAQKADEKDGVWKLPDGDAYYRWTLEQNTTTKLTANEIHAIGLKEVERIQNEMRKIMRKVNFKSDDLQQFFYFMRSHPQFYFSNDAAGKKAYLEKATKIIADMKVQLDKLFVTKPKADIVVKAVEAFREKSAGGAFYEQPALDGSRPGTYYINLYTLADQPIYQMEALAYHEGIPGHHMQIAIAQELKNLPRFRTLMEHTAYVEGWALYAEQIPKEIGFYVDPYSDFGRLAMELFRAARLVVDTGIHLKKWTREEALEYFNRNVPNPEGDNRKEIDRYIVMPGQATGYKIGMMKILELREKARKELADQFDIKQFHDVMLTSGSLPLDVLEQLINDWIMSKKTTKTASAEVTH